MSSEISKSRGMKPGSMRPLHKHSWLSNAFANLHAKMPQKVCDKYFKKEIPMNLMMIQVLRHNIK